MGNDEWKAMTEIEFNGLIFNINSAMDRILAASQPCGEIIKALEPYGSGELNSLQFRSFKQTLELLRLFNFSEERLSEISEELTELSKKIDKVLSTDGFSTADHPCPCWVDMLREESKLFLKMVATK
ncbi:MAG: hypothetical protein WC514_03750 [Candidatus Paceibacterota bacterium]